MPRLATKWSRTQRRAMVAICSATLLLGVGGGVAYATAPSPNGGPTSSFPNLYPCGYRDYAELPPVKLAICKAEEAAIAADRKKYPIALKPAIPPGSPPTTPLPPQAPLTGIFDMRQAPFPPGLFAVQNSWCGQVDGQYYSVYVGQKGNPENQVPEQAGVVVFADPSNVNSGAEPKEVGMFLAPVGDTALRVVSSAGGVLNLVTPSGTKVTFTLPAMTFEKV